MHTPTTLFADMLVLLKRSMWETNSVLGGEYCRDCFSDRPFHSPDCFLQKTIVLAEAHAAGVPFPNVYIVCNECGASRVCPIDPDATFALSDVEPCRACGGSSQTGYVRASPDCHFQLAEAHTSHLTPEA
jgi:hypothetical protein